MNRKLLIIYFAFLYFSCHTSNTDFYNKAITMYHDIIGDSNTILIIPGTGCQGCITGVEDFIINNWNRYKNVILVFTNIKSEKIIRLKFKKIFETYSDKIIIDEGNLFFNINEKEKIYPTVLYLYKRNITKIEFISPTQPLNINQLLNNTNGIHLKRKEVVKTVRR